MRFAFKSSAHQTNQIMGCLTYFPACCKDFESLTDNRHEYDLSRWYRRGRFCHCFTQGKNVKSNLCSKYSQMFGETIKHHFCRTLLLSQLRLPDFYIHYFAELPRSINLQVLIRAFLPKLTLIFFYKISLLQETWIKPWH